MSVGAIKADEGHPCAICNLEYKSAKQLKNHNDNAHPRVVIKDGVVIYPCDYCDSEYK